MMTPMRRLLGGILVLLLAAALAGAAEDELNLFDAEEGDTVTISGGEASQEQVKSGKSSIKWANHPVNKAMALRNYPTDWSAYNKLTFWMYSEKANDAEFMFLVFSENKETEGIDYWSTEIKVNWEGWKFFEFPFHKMGRSRTPAGWNHITGVQFTTTGWGNEPKADTVIYLDDMRLHKMSIKPKNLDFEGGEGNEGVPMHWQAFPPLTSPDVSIAIVDGRSGKAVKITDKDKKNGVGIQQTFPAEAGKTYKIGVWKKGDLVGIYLKWLDSGFSDNGLKNTGAKNTDPTQFEHFELTEKAPEGTKFAQAWIYSYTSNQGEIVVDDVTFEEVK